MWWYVSRNNQASATGHTPNARVIMRLRFVDAFYSVASLKSISRAAEKLFVTQSALSSPGLELELTVETIPILMDLVQRGTLDVVFAAPPAASTGVRNETLVGMEMAFVGSPLLQRSGGKRKRRLMHLTRLPRMPCCSKPLLPGRVAGKTARRIILTI